MATGGRPRRRDKKEESEPSLGTMLAVGVGAIGVAALAYGAKKLYDIVTAEPAKKIPDEDDSPDPTQREMPSPSRNHISSVSPGSSVPRVLPQEVVPPRSSLSDQLNDYLLNYVQVDSYANERAMKVADDIKHSLTRFLQKQFPPFGACNLISIGSAFEKLSVIVPAEVDFLIPAVLTTDDWSLSDEDTDPPGYHSIRQMDRLSTSHLDPLLSECISNGVLSPPAVTGLLMKCVQSSLPHLEPYKVDVYLDKSAIVLRVLPSRDDPVNLTVNLYPSIILQGTLVTSRPHPASISNPRMRQLWQESHSVNEGRMINHLDSTQTCHLQCLQIIKAIRLNHPANFGALPSYVYKMILLRMMQDNPEDEFWKPECLPEQFVDMLNELIYYLQGRNLPSCFNERVNLLESVPDSCCDNIVSFITSRIGKEKLHTLLEQRHLPVTV